MSLLLAGSLRTWQSKRAGLIWLGLWLVLLIAVKGAISLYCSRRSLIQTMGRAARNVNGHVILYADVMTDSMKSAIDETQRRRAIQAEYNEKHGITPQTIVKEIKDFVEREKKIEEQNWQRIEENLQEFSRKKFKSQDAWKKAIEKAMFDAAKQLNFERAAELRDMIKNDDAEGTAS